MKSSTAHSLFALHFPPPTTTTFHNLKQKISSQSIHKRFHLLVAFLLHMSDVCASSLVSRPRTLMIRGVLPPACPEQSRRYFTQDPDTFCSVSSEFRIKSAGRLGWLLRQEVRSGKRGQSKCCEKAFHLQRHEGIRARSPHVAKNAEAVGLILLIETASAVSCWCLAYLLPFSHEPVLVA